MSSTYTIHLYSVIQQKQQKFVRVEVVALGTLLRICGYTHAQMPCFAWLGLVLFDSGLIANPICTIRCRNCYDESSTGMGGVVAVEQRKSKRYKMTAEQNRVLCCIVYGSIECILLSCACKHQRSMLVGCSL